MTRRLSDWARRVHLHCAAQSAELERDVGLTVAEAVALFGAPARSSARRVLERAATAGHFRTVKEPHRDGRRGAWFRARYFPVGPEPELYSRADPRPRPAPAIAQMPVSSVFEQARAFAVEDICRIFGVPPWLMTNKTMEAR